MTETVRDNLSVATISAILIIADIFSFMGGNNARCLQIQYFIFALSTFFTIIAIDYKYFYDRPPQRFRWFEVDRNDKFEVAFVLWGWVFLFCRMPGLATFRGLRLFRYMAITAYDYNLLTLGTFFKTTWTLFRKCRLFLSVVEQELRHSMIVPMLFVYAIITVLTGIVITNIVSEVVNNENIEENHCCTVTRCIMTMFRLSVFNAEGFDFLDFILRENENSHNVVIILIVFMVFNGIVLKFGLVGMLANIVFKPLIILFVPVVDDIQNLCSKRNSLPRVDFQSLNEANATIERDRQIQMRRSLLLQEVRKLAIYVKSLTSLTSKICNELRTLQLLVSLRRRAHQRRLSNDMNRSIVSTDKQSVNYQRMSESLSTCDNNLNRENIPSHCTIQEYKTQFIKLRDLFI